MHGRNLCAFVLRCVIRLLLLGCLSYFKYSTLINTYVISDPRRWAIHQWPSSTCGGRVANVLGPGARSRHLWILVGLLRRALPFMDQHVSI
jgi:hypothetical protein